jgi:hypothetical protein
MPTAHTKIDATLFQGDLFGIEPTNDIPQINHMKDANATVTSHYIEKASSASQHIPTTVKSAGPTFSSQSPNVSKAGRQGKASNAAKRSNWPNPSDPQFKRAFSDQPPDFTELDDPPPQPEIDQVIDSDTTDVKLAKLMFHRFKYDLGFNLSQTVKPNEVLDQAEMFGATTTQATGAGVRAMDKLNAIVWLYSLHPQKVQISVEWVCDVLDLDLESIRRIVARNVQREIRHVIELIAPLDKKHAQVCEDKVSEYVSVSGWAVY